jgi:5-methyltetrahydrofolate--homocysteine methyltransferase
VAAGSLIGELTAAGPVLTDGAWGTEMQARGLAAGETPDFWNLSHPDRVEQVARAYVTAGSQVVLTNTFRANRIALAKHPDVERITEVNRAGVEISRRAAGDQARVFASIGPCGKLLITGEVDEAALHAAFAEQARALAAGGADAIVVETMSDLAEAGIAVEAAKATGLPVVACMVFDSGKNRDRTMMGVTPTQAAEELTRIGADAIGANCGTGVEDYIPICASLAAATPLPVWIKPNAGLPELENGEVVYRTTPSEFAANVPKLLEAGARFVGGCCGTIPEFIQAMRRELDD